MTRRQEIKVRLDAFKKTKQEQQASKGNIIDWSCAHVAFMNARDALLNHAIDDLEYLLITDELKELSGIEL